MDTRGEYARVRGWLVSRLNLFGRENTPGTIEGGNTGATEYSTKFPQGTSHWQRGCPELIPGKFRPINSVDAPERGLSRVCASIIRGNGSGAHGNTL